jgi:hypothetical protein
MTFTPARPALLTATLAVAIGSAGATPTWAANVQYTFDVLIDAGPLLSNSYTGSFSYDDSTVSSAGPSSIGLTDFLFNFVNQVYTTSDDPSGAAEFADGVFLGLSYAVASAPQPTFIPGFFGASDASFAYDLQPGGTGQGGTGTIAYRKVVAPPSTSVPAPAPVLGAAAFFGCSRRLRRKIAQRRGVASASIE